MKINADTNVLVRVLTLDDPEQAQIARDELSRAELVAIAMPTLCELVWVLTRVYRADVAVIAEAVRGLIATEKVELNRSAAEAGLAALEGGGDFADGVIAHEGAWLGAEEFVSFDKQAVRALVDRGVSARLLGR